MNLDVYTYMYTYIFMFIFCEIGSLQGVDLRHKFVGVETQSDFGTHCESSGPATSQM